MRIIIRVYLVTKTEPWIQDKGPPGALFPSNGGPQLVLAIKCTAKRHCSCVPDVMLQLPTRLPPLDYYIFLILARHVVRQDHEVALLDFDVIRRS